MMKKQLFATLTALGCALSMTALTSSAISEQTWEVVEGKNGFIDVMIERGRYDGILVETDGTALTADMIDSFDEFTALQTWEEYTSSIIYWAGWSKTETSEIPEGECYMLSTAEMDDEALLTLGRKLMLEQTCIKNIYLVNYELYGDGDVMPNLEVTPKSDVLLSELAIPELAEFEISDVPSYIGSYSCVLDQPRTSEFCSGYDFDSPDRTEYGYYLYLKEKADLILKNNSDTLESVTVTTIVADSAGDSECTASSIWDTAGDHNADGTVNAQDGADILQLAAELGTGARTAISSASDVNADGTVDAQDAAAVLTFAAASGSGSPLTWVEILR